MKRGTPRHPKTIALAKRLGIPIPHAVGILEMLWHFAGDFSPRGDIGRNTDGAIAAAVHWRKPATLLVDALRDEHWLDAHPDYRLIVHDWPDHADDAVKKKLWRSGEKFLPVYPEKPPPTPTASRRRPDGVALTRAEGGAGLGSSLKELPCVSQNFGEWPLSGAAMKARFPGIGIALVMDIVNRAYIAWVAEAHPKIEFTDAVVAQAVERVFDAHQYSPGLFKETVPNCIGLWAAEGIKPPDPPPNGNSRASRAKQALAEAIADAERREKSGEIDRGGSHEITGKAVAYDPVSRRQRRAEGDGASAHGCCSRRGIGWPCGRRAA